MVQVLTCKCGHTQAADIPEGSVLPPFKCAQCVGDPPELDGANLARWQVATLKGWISVLPPVWNVPMAKTQDMGRVSTLPLFPQEEAAASFPTDRLGLSLEANFGRAVYQGRVARQARSDWLGL